MCAFLEGEMDGNRRRGFANRDGHTMIAHQEADLFAQIMPEKIEPGDGCRIVAGGRDMAICQT